MSDKPLWGLTPCNAWLGCDPVTKGHSFEAYLSTNSLNTKALGGSWSSGTEMNPVLLGHVGPFGYKCGQLSPWSESGDSPVVNNPDSRLEATSSPLNLLNTVRCLASSD
jgi:hypothetical protein